MKIYNKLSTILLAVALSVSAIGFTACDNDDDEFGTNQYVSKGVHLNVFGPSPVARGGELRFIGSGMDQITSIEIPGCSPITDITRISTEEIRVTVPQTAEVGKVVLNWASGSLTTKTQLTYTEPISLDSFSPTTVKAGAELTIKGEYLNLIGEVIFTDGVSVLQEDFVSQSRSEIKVIVPVEAQSGKIVVSDAAIDIPNWIYSDEELIVVLPSVSAPLDLTSAKGGDVVTVTGKDFDLITAVILPSGESIDYVLDGDKLTFTLPEDITDGAIVVETASGVHVAVANIGVVVPVIEKVEPQGGLRADDIITIQGVNMDQVKDVLFPNVEAVTPSEISATQIKVKMPAMAQSGEVQLNLKSGKAVGGITISTAKPEVLGFNPDPVAAAAELTMTGKDLDLVTEVTFAPGITVTVSPTVADKLTLTVPASATTGTLVLKMANGETVGTAQLNVDSPQCAFITETITEEPRGGDLLIVKVSNGSKLTEVKVNGASVQYILTGETLYISLPQTAGKNTEVKLISSNGEISYTYDVIPATEIENVIWTGAWENAAWAGNQDLGWGGYDWSTVPAGATLTLYMTPTVNPGEWWCVSLRHGQGWEALPGNLGMQIDMPADGIASVVLTQEVLDDLVANGGLVITGQGYILTKVTLSWKISLETTLWEGEAVVDNWTDQPYMLSDTGTELAAAGASAGQTVYFYFKALESDWKVEILEGHWGPSYGAWCAFGSDTENGKFTEYDLEGNGGKIGLTLTQAILDAAYTQQWWGGVFVLNGDNLICTKITLE